MTPFFLGISLSWLIRWFLRLGIPAIFWLSALIQTQTNIPTLTFLWTLNLNGFPLWVPTLVLVFFAWILPRKKRVEVKYID